MKFRRVPVLAVLVLSACTAFHADAQYGRRDRGGSGQMQAPPRDREETRNMASAIPDPFGALERELPSLKVDMQIRADQLVEWQVFERDVRDIAEMERARRRQLLALRDMTDKSPNALALINSLADADRLKADATAELRRHAEALYGKLDDAQRRTFDRRTVQSQTEPLGVESRNPPR